MNVIVSRTPSVQSKPKCTKKFWTPIPLDYWDVWNTIYRELMALQLGNCFWIIQSYTSRGWLKYVTNFNWTAKKDSTLTSWIMINAMLLVGGLSIHRLRLVYNGDGDTYNVYFSPYYFINTIDDVQLIALFSLLLSLSF